MLGADFFALDPRAGTVREVLSLSTALDDPMPGFVQSDGGFPLWYRLWAVCGGDEIRAYDRVRNQLRGFSADGRELSPVDLPAPWPTEVTPEEFARAVFPLRRAEITGDVSGRMTGEDSTRAINQMVGELKGKPDELATYLPRYVDFRCSDDGTLWLQPIDLDAGGLQGSRTWLRVAPEGEVRRVRLPDRFDPLRFTETRIWGVERDELDIGSVAWIGLPDRASK